MRLELSHFRQAETEFSRQFEPAAFVGGDDEYRVVAPVALGMTIHKDKDRFRMVGSVQTVLELGCSRCLELFSMPVDRTFDLRYVPATTGTPAADGDDGDDDTEVGADDASMTVYRDEQVDLIELLCEQFYLALPMKPLCRPDCKGICPECGSHRNQAPCGCQPHWEDPRMAGLKTLMTNRKHDDA